LTGACEKLQDSVLSSPAIEQPDNDSPPNNTPSAPTETVNTNIEQMPLTFTGEYQMTMANVDSLGRAIDSHIQLKDSEEPTDKRASRLNYDPPGWHNYKMKYDAGNGQIKEAWLMSRGHLVGYQFCGLNDEPRNLTPETAWFNAGNYNGMNDSNEESMLYYENKLDKWLRDHPDYRLDYQVTPIYIGNELIARQIRLAYIGFNKNGETVEIYLGSPKETKGNSNATVVNLDNISPNAIINYAEGTAIGNIH
jgi:DNA-entry nuclease